MKQCSYHHWDLDGVISKIFHDKIYGAKYSKASGYPKINKILNDLVSKGYESITFTDLAITPEQMQFCVDNFEEVRFFDHHIQTEETYALFKDHPKVKECVFRKDLSGAGIMFVEMINKKISTTPELALLAKLGDVYDLWHQDSPYWDEAFKLNDLFWIYSFFDFEKRFINGFDGFTIKENQLIEDKRKEIESILDKSPMEEINGTEALIIMPTDRGTTSHLTFMIPDYQFYYIITFDDRSNCFTLSCRTSNTNLTPKNTDLDASLKRTVAECDQLVNGGGHKMAAGATFAGDMTVQEIIAFIKEEIHPRVCEDAFKEVAY